MLFAHGSVMLFVALPLVYVVRYLRCVVSCALCGACLLVVGSGFGCSLLIASVLSVE